MPSCPGSLLVMPVIHAGTVIGGMALSNGPHTPSSMSPRRLGSSSRQRSNTSSGGAQSNPISSSFLAPGTCSSACGLGLPAHPLDEDGGHLGPRKLRRQRLTPLEHFANHRA